MSLKTNRNKTSPHRAEHPFWNPHRTCIYSLEMFQERNWTPSSCGLGVVGQPVLELLKPGDCRERGRFSAKGTKGWADAGAHLGQEWIQNQTGAAL